MWNFGSKLFGKNFDCVWNCAGLCNLLVNKNIITRMRSNPRYKLGRISFFFFVMVVANCNANCYWLHVYCSQWQLLLFFPFRIKIAFVAIWRVSCGELGFCLTRCTNPELVAKCEHILGMTSCELNEQAAKPKFVAQS